jgi:hypothetical protein
MGELSFLTIIVSLAVCSLLVYGIFQYMKVRLTVLEQSHREQAMILQQYIEESSLDIHRLYRISTERSDYGNDKRQLFPSNDSIILEYQEEPKMNDKPNVYNEPHTIHLDTAFFQNKRTNHLIEISSDSENTTDSEDDDSSSTDDDSSSSTDDSSTDDSSSSSTDDEVEKVENYTVHTTESSNLDDTNESCEIVTDIMTNIPYEPSSHSPDVKTVTVDLGTTEPDTSNDNILYMMYKKAQQTPLPEDNEFDVANSLEQEQDTVNDAIPANANPLTPVPSSAPVHVPLSSMSVPDLKQLLKELCKNQPEKHAEIQRLKKSELIYAIKQLQQ